MGKRQNSSNRDKILTASIWRLMATMSLPAIIAMSINGINTFVDALFVGQYIGQNALAAVSLVLPLTMITNGFAAMVGMGSASLLSIAIGNEDEDIQRKILGTSTLLSFIISIVLTALGWYFAPALLAMMGGTGEIQDLGVIYYRIILLGSFFRIYGVAINMLIRAEGKVAEAMGYAIVTALLNIALNVLFIGYLGMGVEGAAWSTVIAMGVLSLLNIWYFYIGRKASFPISFTQFSLEGKLLRPIIKVGVSAMLLQILFFVEQVIIFRSLAHYGGDWDITFMGACYRIILLVLIPGYGFAQALQPIVGINYGAEEYQRVKKAFYIFFISYTIMLFLGWLFVVLYPRTTLGWMMPDATFSSTDILNYLLMLAPLPLNPFFLMITTLFQGIGKGRSASMLQIGREIILFIPFVLILPIWYGITGIYATRLPINVIIIIVAYFMMVNQFKEWSKAEAAL